MSQPTVSSDLFQSLQVFTELAVQSVGKDLVRFTVNDVPLSVEEPGRDFELGRVLDDRNNSFKLIGVQLSGTLVQIDISLLAGNVCQSSTDTTNLGKGKHDFDSAINVGVEETKNVLELLVGFGYDERHDGWEGLIECRAGWPAVVLELG